jgi:hypothetical protein
MGLGDLRSALATRLATASVKQVYARPPEVPAQSPSVVVGEITWTVVPGEREVSHYTTTVEVWVSRLATDDAAIALAETVVEEIRAALAGAVTLGGSVAHAFVTGGTGNRWFELGGALWLVTSLVVEATVRQTRGYTP